MVRVCLVTATPKAGVEWALSLKAETTLRCLRHFRGSVFCGNRDFHVPTWQTLCAHHEIYDTLKKIENPKKQNKGLFKDLR